MFALAGASLYFIGGLSYGLNKMCYNFKNKYFQHVHIVEQQYVLFLYEGGNFMSEKKPVVSILMGSRSDLPTMEACFAQLKEFDIPFEAHALSAHRTPNEVISLAESAKDRGIKVIIAAAGGAAHLGGVIASSTTLPVIGVPIQTSALGGMDSLLSTVQMPGGIPVATVAIGKAGAKNAAILAAQMIALQDEKLAEKLVEFKKAMAEKVIKDSVIEVE